MLDDIVAHDIAQGIGTPTPATKDSLLPPWTRIASCLRPHPAGLALLITEQTFQKQACVPRNPFLPEQWTYPLLKLLKRAAHNASVSSIDAACVHDLRIMVAHGFRNLRKGQ